jgi:8-oxo-dGTP pyrophosphatase MutT (NUDIX family)
MPIGRFYGGIGGLVWSPAREKYLLLKRSREKDFAGGVWECVTGRVDQGEGFEDALHREVREELGVAVRIEFLIGTTHFFRGEVHPENELIGVVYGCSLADESQPLRVSAEHSEHRWVTADEALALLATPDPSTQWMRRVIKRAEKLRHLLPPELRRHYRERGLELDQ